MTPDPKLLEKAQGVVEEYLMKNPGDTFFLENVIAQALHLHGQEERRRAIEEVIALLQKSDPNETRA